MRVSRGSPSAAGPPQINTSFSSQNQTSKKVDFLAPNGSPTDFQGDLKILKIRLRRPPKTRLRKSLEKVTKKSPNLTPSTCLNLVRGLKNQGFPVFRKSIQIDLPKPPFWRPFGLQNRKKSFREGAQKTSKNNYPKSRPKAPKRTPKSVTTLHCVGTPFSRSLLRGSQVPPRYHF